MTFIPQALADPVSRSVLFVWHDEENFRRYWEDKVKTIDAPGVPAHPRLVKVGDVIDLFSTGWNKGTVSAVEFSPDDADIPDWHRSGSFRFTYDGGYINVRVDGRLAIGAPIFAFPADKPDSPK